MCYSAGVQLTTSLLIFATCGVFYFHFRSKYAHLRPWLLRFLDNVTLLFLCIGGHQFFEFLSLTTGSQFIYKTGLLLSMTGMYFGLRCLEVMVDEDLHSKIALGFIAGVGIHLYLVPVRFEANKSVASCRGSRVDS